MNDPMSGLEGLTVRRAVAGDDPRCGVILSESVLNTSLPARVPHAGALFADRSPLPDGGYERRVAELGGRLVGFLDFDPSRGYLKYLFVDPACQRRGVGAALLEVAERAIAGPVSLTTLSANDEALYWYLRRGYAIVGGELQEDWHGGPVIWLRLRKEGR